MPTENLDDQGSKMPGFPPDVAEMIINTVMRVDQFNSDSSLRAMFITTELAPFKDQVPDANSKYDRAHKVMKWMAESGKKEIVLAFLKTLEARYQTGDGMKNDLQKVIQSVTNS